MPAPVAYIVDFDSTLVERESFDDFGALVLADDPERESVCAELEELTALGMTGELPFDESLAKRLALFRAHRDHIPLLNEQLAAQLSPSAVERRDWFAEHQDSIYVVSGGFEEFIKPTVQRLGILAANVYANRFIFDADGNIIGHDRSRFTAQSGGKPEQVRALGLEGRVVAIGDGYTDLEIRLQGAADEFWAYTETATRPNVVAGADRVLASFLEMT